MDKVLRQFLEVATTRNVTQAAKKLCMNQSTLSINIRRLEETLGVPLLIRSSSGVALTEFGHVVLEEARIMQRLHDNTLAKITLLKERLERGLKLGTGHAEWHLFIREGIRSYRKRHPSANIHVEVGNNLRLMDQLLSGDLDLFTGNEIHGLSRNAGVRFLPLYSSEERAFVRAGHPLTFRQGCRREDLAEYPTVYLTPDESRYNYVMDEAYLKQQGLRAFHLTDKTIYSSNSIEACVDTLVDTQAILYFPGIMDAYFADLGIVSLDLHDALSRTTVGIYLMRERQEEPQLQDMCALIRTFLTPHQP